jgi:hypothetical protein
MTLTSRKSASTSAPKKPEKPQSLKRSRVLKRGGVRFEPFADAHMAYAWAAYKRGVFERRGIVMPGKDVGEFSTAMAEHIENSLASTIEVWTAFADTPHGNIPVGFIRIGFSGDPKLRAKVGLGTVLAHPNVIWYPEASPRNRVETAVLLLRELKKEHLVLMAVKDADAPFLRHMGKYGLLRAVGLIWDYYRAGENATLFQTVGD